MVELECLKVRAKALEADVPVPTSHGLQICAMALGPSTQSQELRVPIAETSVHPSPQAWAPLSAPSLGLRWTLWSPLLPPWPQGGAQTKVLWD